MKTVLVALGCLLISGPVHAIEVGSASLTCVNSSEIPDSYSVTVFTKNGNGVAVLSKAGQVILVEPVDTSKGRSTFAVIEGENLEMTVDPEDGLTGKLRYTIGGKTTDVSFHEEQCSFIPKGFGRP